MYFLGKGSSPKKLSTKLRPPSGRWDWLYPNLYIMIFNPICGPLGSVCAHKAVWDSSLSWHHHTWHMTSKYPQETLTPQPWPQDTLTPWHHAPCQYYTISVITPLWYSNNGGNTYLTWRYGDIRKYIGYLI